MYVLIGGNPYRGYTGTMTYTDLGVITKVKTKKEAAEAYRKYYDDCGGLLRIFDSETLEFVNPEDENA